MTAENPHAGQGAVIVDIGGEIGALVVVMPDTMLDAKHEIEVEVEIVPTGTARSVDDRTRDADHGPHDHDHAHEHDHEHDHPHDHDDGDDHVHPPHVAVVARPLPDGRLIPSLVFGSLQAGRYDLYLRPDGPVALTVDVVGGEVTEAVWPSG